MKTFVIVFTCLLFVIPSQAEIIVVDADRAGDGSNIRTASVTGRSIVIVYPTIQAAIDAAVNGDTIIVSDGTYTGTGNRDIDFLGKAITVRSTDQFDPDVVAATIIDCEGRGRGFRFQNSEDANSILSGFTIINGQAHNGGGIYCIYSSPTISNCTIIGNKANNDGGGIYCDVVSPTIRNCVITGNNADYGGGMSNDNSSPTVTNCRFVDNEAVYWGGGMFNGSGSSPTVSNSSFTDNEAYYGGGGMYCYSIAPHLDITNCLFRDNNAANGHGGAMCIDASAQRIAIKSCTFSQNSADSGYGGAIYNYNSHPVVVNSILWDNSDSTDEDWDVVVDSIYGFSISYSDFSGIGIISGTVSGSGWIHTDPQFADPDNGDFHLKSKDGRWDPVTESWVTDSVYSKCLAHAHPLYDYSNEPVSGGKINMGAYGNTAEASKMQSSNLGSLNVIVYILPEGDPGPYNAQWKLSYEQDGTWHNPYNTGGFTMEGLVPAQDYTVYFKDVSGYTTPEPYSFWIYPGETTVIGGAYWH